MENLLNKYDHKTGCRTQVSGVITLMLGDDFDLQSSQMMCDKVSKPTLHLEIMEIRMTLDVTSD